MDQSPVAVLAALNIADDLFKVRAGREPSSQATEIQTVAQRLISRIDEALADEESGAGAQPLQEEQGHPS